MDSYPGPLGQALTNLAFNALTHGFPGNRKGMIMIKVAAAKNAHIELILADNGCGMAPEVKRQAFDPFFTTRRHHGATGLGLHIAHSIVTERLGGQLKLDSEPGMGTTIHLSLPRTAPSV
jgi:signal transduction histidine kinase